MTRRRERGVALIAAVLVVALATVLIAAMLDRSEASLARTRNLQRAEQGGELMRGMEAWAGLALQRDAEADGIDSRDDAWAQALPPIELPGIRIFGTVRELNGCFNLNALHHGGSDDALAIARFERLLRALHLDPAIAQQVLDWIDEDAFPRAQGAEDQALLGARVPLRAANQAFVHVSELRLLPAITPQVYAILAPEVCALPAGSLINLNFASPALWMSLADAITPAQAQRLARDGQARYDSLEAVAQELEQIGIAQVSLDGHGVGSDWFVLEATIEVDHIPFVHSSLLHRRPNGVEVLARSRGRL